MNWAEKCAMESEEEQNEDVSDKSREEQENITEGVGRGEHIAKDRN